MLIRVRTKALYRGNAMESLGIPDSDSPRASHRHCRGSGGEDRAKAGLTAGSRMAGRVHHCRFRHGKHSNSRVFFYVCLFFVLLVVLWFGVSFSRVSFVLPFPFEDGEEIIW